MGLNSGVPRTRPKQTVKTATRVSIEMSRGREEVVVEWEEARVDKVAVLVECRAECSWAE
jgi:hypothetical protein